MLDPSKAIVTTADAANNNTNDAKILQDLAVTYTGFKGWELSLGQKKITLTEEGVRSSSELDFPERSQIVRAVSDRRETGFFVQGRHRRARHALGLRHERHGVEHPRRLERHDQRLRPRGHQVRQRARTSAARAARAAARPRRTSTGRASAGTPGSTAEGASRSSPRPSTSTPRTAAGPSPRPAPGRLLRARRSTRSWTRSRSASGTTSSRTT